MICTQLQAKEDLDNAVQSLPSKHSQDIEEVKDRLDAIKVSIVPHYYSCAISTIINDVVKYCYFFAKS